MEEFDGGFLASSQKHEYTGVKTIRSLSAKQINAIPVDEGSVLLVDRHEVSNLQACGYISSVKKISPGFVFEINDGTGKLDCALWVNTDFDALMGEQVVENNLVRVTGSIKTFANKKTLNVSNIVRTTSNEFLYHLTSVLYQHLFMNNKLDRTEEKKNTASMLNRIQNDILEVYRNNQDGEGLDIEIVIAMLKDKYSENEVRNNVESLLSNCHLYSVDGSNYKTTI